jgi:hypothetical protein
MSTLITIAGVYFFVLLGFVAKRKFSEIHERTLVLLSIYFLQPMLSFWGIFGRKIELGDLFVPAWYFVISILGATVGYLIFSRVFDDKKDSAIVTAGGIIGNTGNLGIPLLIAIFGKSVAFYAVLINLANVFVLYIIGVFLYSRGNYTVGESIKNILSIPVIWFSLLAIVLNFAGVTLHPSINQTIEMGAYTSMCIQLIIFGVFLGGLTKASISKKVLVYGLLNKFAILPLIAFVLLTQLDLLPLIKTLIFLQVCMPLAVSNVNLASLYGCKPYDVTALIMASSALFLVLIFLYYPIFS